jgi:hypothetical protein
MPLPLVIGAVLAVLAAVGLFVLGAGALRSGARLAVFLFLLAAVGSLTAGGIALTLGLGMASFDALPESAAVAEVEIRATGPGAFTAAFRFGDDSEMSFSLPGDTLVVETAVLTWRPLARLVGLGTSYRLGAVRGRGAPGLFAAPGGAFQFGAEPRVDLAALLDRLPPLGILYRVTRGEVVLPVPGEPRRVDLLAADGVIAFR